ncbi:MAG: outer membrane lipoprotein-sorting protein [candidate division WOR-3 bacterium]|nr:outer membrane lipoprotein-sorting protein [candidate division WOR-3 bacterium]
MIHHRKHTILMILLHVSLAAILPSGQLTAQEEMTADEILKTLTETMNPEQSHGTMTMTIVTSSGQERTFKYETFSKDKGDKSLMKYLEPQRVKGQTILMLNDANDIWTYFPRTKRVRKLATHAKKQKVEGSDFSYEDMGASDAFIEEYNALRLNDENKEGRSCYKIELTRKAESNASYSRVMLWIDKENFIPLVVDYYHEDDPELHEKQLVCHDVELIEDIYTPMDCTMFNKLDNTYTKMHIVDITYQVDLADDLFTEMGMQR